MLYLADPGRGKVQPIGRKGLGPGENQRPTGVFPWRGDTSALYDMAARRVLLILPDGQPGASFDPRAVAQCSFCSVTASRRKRGRSAAQQLPRPLDVLPVRPDIADRQPDREPPMQLRVRQEHIAGRVHLVEDPLVRRVGLGI